MRQMPTLPARGKMLSESMTAAPLSFIIGVNFSEPESVIVVLDFSTLTIY
jgi:hypothetical protein